MISDVLIIIGTVVNGDAKNRMIIQICMILILIVRTLHAVKNVQIIINKSKYHFLL